MCGLVLAAGQTGRYVLTMKLRGAERRLVADECPLQVLAQLGQLTAEVQFVLHRTGSSLSEGPSAATRPRSSEPHEHKKPNGTSSYASSIRPRTYKPNRSWSPSPRASPEPRASPVSFTHRLHHTKASSSWKEEVFRQVLQQQRRLQDLEMQLQSLERETALWEWDRSTVPAPSLTPEELQELKVLEELEEELGEELEQMEELEEQLQAAMDRERGTCSTCSHFSRFGPCLHQEVLIMSPTDMTTHLQQMQASLDEQSQQISELHARSEHLEQDLKTSVQSPSCRPASPQEEEEVLRPLQEQLLQRLQQTEELDVTLCETRRELRAAEERLQVTSGRG